MMPQRHCGKEQTIAAKSKPLVFGLVTFLEYQEVVLDANRFIARHSCISSLTK